MNYSQADIEYWGEEYLRLRHALPDTTTFQVFLVAPQHYKRYAENRIRDWTQNPRIMPMAHHSPILLN